MSEDEFLAAVQAADPRFERVAAEADAARADVLAAGVRPNPSFVFDREEVFPDEGLATHYARLSLPIQISGQRGRRVAAARTDVAAAAATAESARVELIVQALRSYHDAAFARMVVETLRAERDHLVRVVEIVRNRVGAGAASGHDLRRIELELANYDDLLGGAEIRLFEARARLAALVGHPDGLVDATSALPLPMAPAPVEHARLLESRGDYRAAQLRARSAGERAAAAARGWIPDLDVTGGVMSADLGVETALGYTIGLAVTVPVFDRGGAAAARAPAGRGVAAGAADIIEAHVATAVRTRRSTLERRIARAEQIATEQIARLDELLRSAETAYREGASGVVELLDAYRTARDTRVRELELRRDARLAELDLWLALGRRP